jgi:hypothetical protein
VNPKSFPNHEQYLQTLMRMSPEQRLNKAFELSDLVKTLFLDGLKKAFADKSETEIRKIYLERIAQCYNRNY